MAIVIETPRLIIRHPEHHDIDALVKIYAARACARFLGGVKNPAETRTRFEAIIDLQTDLPEQIGTWVIHHKKDNFCIGEAGLQLYEADGVNDVAMHGVLAFRYWGEGLAKEFFSALRDYSFFDLGLQRVIAKIDPGNRPSLQVASDIFMEFEKELEGGCHLYAVEKFCWLDDERSKYFQSYQKVMVGTPTHLRDG